MFWSIKKKAQIQLKILIFGIERKARCWFVIKIRYDLWSFILIFLDWRLDSWFTWILRRFGGRGRIGREGNFEGLDINNTNPSIHKSIKFTNWRKKFTKILQSAYQSNSQNPSANRSIKLKKKEENPNGNPQTKENVDAKIPLWSSFLIEISDQLHRSPTASDWPRWVWPCSSPPFST